MNKILFFVLCLPIVLTIKLHAKKAEGNKRDTGKIEKIVGMKGQFDEKEQVLKFNVPRDDLKVMINKVNITPPFGLSSWVSFKNNNDGTLLMGDLALTQDQVNPVMSTLLENGLQVTALHNHLLWESPRIMFMHIEGLGKGPDLAKAIHAVFEKIKSSANDQAKLPDISVDPEKIGIDTTKIENIIGKKGTLTKGVYKVVLGRTAETDGRQIGSLMGVNSWVGFMGSEEEAVINGDLATVEGEVQGVLKALRDAGINVVSIHQHMLQEKPRYIYIHFYGIGKAEDLAKAMRTALDVMSSGS